MPVRQIKPRPMTPEQFITATAELAKMERKYARMVRALRAEIGIEPRCGGEAQGGHEEGRSRRSPRQASKAGA